MSVCLELSTELPHDEHLSRWIGEPLKGVVIPTSVFVANKSGFPVLPRSHQGFVRELLHRKVQPILWGRGWPDDSGYRGFADYLKHMFRSSLTVRCSSLVETDEQRVVCY